MRSALAGFVRGWVAFGSRGEQALETSARYRQPETNLMGSSNDC